MKNKRNYLLVVLILCFVTLSSAQRRKAKGTVNIVNGFSIGGGITSFDILTDNFSTIEKDGWIVNMSATVEIPHKWFNVSYGMQLSENNIGIAVKDNSMANISSSKFSDNTIHISAYKKNWQYGSAGYADVKKSLFDGSMNTFISLDNSRLNISNSVIEGPKFLDGENIIFN